MNYKPFFDIAYKEACRALEHDDIPVGAAIIKNGELISSGHNECIQQQNATLHAEIVVINKACQKLKSWRLDGCILISSLEPCCMCTGAIMQSRIQKVIFNALDEKTGCILSKYTLADDKQLNQHIDYEYIQDKRSSDLLKKFFQHKR